MHSMMLPSQAPFAAQSSELRRWLYVVSHTEPRYGGLSTAVPAAGASLSAGDKVSVSLAAFCRPGERYLPDGYRGDRITFWPASRRAWLFNRALWQVFKREVSRADGVHIHGLWEESTAVASQLARAQGKPYVLSAHGMLEPWALAHGRLKKLIYAALVERETVARAACLHALTRQEARQYRRFGAKAPIAVIPNAVSVPAKLDPELFLGQHPELRGKRVVLFMARLHPKKGADLLVEAWSQVARDWPQAHLVLAGPDSDGMRARLEATAARDGLQHRISVPGMLDQDMKWSALAAAECFVLPSHSEGLSMGVLEAMGAGVPVVITHACNMPEVTRERAGWEIEPESAAIAACLRDLLSRSPAENRQTGRRGADLIRLEYSPARVSAQMEEVYAFVSDGIVPRTVELLVMGGRPAW